jgi:hypothetical protein
MSEQKCAYARSRCGERGFRACMAAADDDHIECLWKLHGR